VGAAQVTLGAVLTDMVSLKLFRLKADERRVRIGSSLAFSGVSTYLSVLLHGLVWVVADAAVKHSVGQRQVVLGDIDEALLGSFSIKVARNGVGSHDPLHELVVVVDLFLSILLLVLRVAPSVAGL